jgi:hypothetical protein
VKKPGPNQEANKGDNLNKQASRTKGLVLTWPPVWLVEP